MKLTPYVRLTIWYAAILMVLSLAFSVWVYNETMAELRAGFNGSLVLQFQNKFGQLPRETLQRILEDQYAVSQGRIISQLIVLNIGVLIVGAAASYWLARKTMGPIEHALEAQHRFTADASHELRTPLAAMKTEIEVSLRDPNPSKADMRELLESNLEEIDRMSNLAQGLLTLARPGESIRLRAIAAKPLVLENIKRYKPLADAKKIAIVPELDNVQMLGEEKGISAIVGILLDNAIKYSPDASQILVRLARKDSYVLLSVTDKGPGIPEADLPHIFERFFRSDASRSKQVNGNGLGLSIAKKTADMLHGTIIAKSEVGEGSTFTLRLAVGQ